MSKRHEVNDGEYHSQPTPKSSKWVLKKWRPTKKSGEGSSVRQEAVEEEVVVEKTNPPRWVTIGKECLKYLDDYWLTNYRFRFVTCWTSSRRNYGENTTNRAESEHHALKSHLRTRRATLEQLVGFIEAAQRTQLGELKEKLGTSRFKTMAHHANIRLFDRIRGRVSIKCLDLLYKEIDRLHRVLKVHNFSCGHQLYTGCGIPCACRLEQMLEIPDYVMPLEDIDPFWRKLNYEKPAYPGKFDDFHGDEGLDRSEAESNEYAVTQPKSSQKSTFEKMMNFWNKARPSPKYKEPEVKTNTRGRPTTKAKEERDEQRAQEQARHSSYTGPKNSYTEPPRYSSYVGSQETVDLGQSSQKKQTQAKKGKKEVDSDTPDLSDYNLSIYGKDIPTYIKRQHIKKTNECRR
ncbi:hypothetical protein SSX86_022911 [Deinandra increscens subsp. villosa]|uniref:Protein FAR1-RELATED SEQUENCE n=1 Tax=Deinandra increscens subsp. villosa TaxID=3103831 RepID=A0AAP0CLD1_9ASTR